MNVLLFGMVTAMAGTPATVRAPLPEVDMGGLIYLQAAPTDWHSCQLIAVLDQHGYVRTTMIEDCPGPLLDETMATLARWDFYPPTAGGVAHSADVIIDFRYISGVVVTDPPPGDDRPRVRVPPAALPLWPVPPRLKGVLKQEVKTAGEDGLLCQLSLSFNDRGGPENVEVLSCPPGAVDLALKRLKKYGVQLVEAKPGDGSRYLYEVWLPVGRPRRGG